MIDLPPPSYEQTIEAIVECDIPRGNVRVAYADYLQSDEVTITDLRPITDKKLRCLKDAVYPFYILSIEDASQHRAFSEFSRREDRPKEKSEALDWLRTKGMLSRLPAFDSGQSLADFAIAVELACDLESGTALMATGKSWIAVRPDAFSVDTFEKSALDLECLTKMFAASDAYEGGVSFGFIGSEAVSEEVKKQ